MSLFFRIIFFIFIIMPHVLQASEGMSSPPRDPLEKMRYDVAFNLNDTFLKYKDLLQHYGCWENVATEKKQRTQRDSYHLLDSEGSNEHTVTNFLPDIKDDPAWAKFQTECISKLNNERSMTLLVPAREAGSLIFLMTGATFTLLELAGSDSFGGSFGIFAVMFNGVFFLRDVIRSFYNIAFTPTSPLDKLERKFSTRQCFIPRPAWNAIIEKFMTARQNPFQQKDALDYLKFTLGLTFYAPRSPLNIPHNIQEKHIEISLKINNFFNDYNPIENKLQIPLLRKNIKNFTKRVLGDKNVLLRHIYFEGPGGIGKTRFAKELTQWINDIVPDSVLFLEMIITAPEELEGNKKKPGFMLRILRDICDQKKRGAIVICDEANWLNEEDYNGPAKRVLDPKSLKINTVYLGNGLEGDGVSLEKPPILIIFASNNKIKDDALASRFVNFSFPTPKEHSLKEYAERLTNKFSSATHRQQLSEEINGVRSFRKIEEITDALIESWESN